MSSLQKVYFRNDYFPMTLETWKIEDVVFLFRKLQKLLEELLYFFFFFEKSINYAEYFYSERKYCPSLKALAYTDK